MWGFRRSQASRHFFFAGKQCVVEENELAQSAANHFL
jgi:hypothetical protein